MRYSIKKSDGSLVVIGRPLAEAMRELESRVNVRGEVGESVVHDPVYPLFVSDEQGACAGYTLYDSLNDMVARASKSSLKVRITLSEDRAITTASLIDITSSPPQLTVGVSARGVTDLVVYETLLETASTLKSRREA